MIKQQQQQQAPPAPAPAAAAPPSACEGIQRLLMAAWREWNGIVSSWLYIELFFVVGGIGKPLLFSRLDFWPRFFSFPKRSSSASVISGDLRWVFSSVHKGERKKDAADLAVAVVAGHWRGEVHDYSAFMLLRVPPHELPSGGS